jgi:hypothetical protein
LSTLLCKQTAPLVGGHFINLVNLGLIVCTDSYVEKALPECGVSVLKFFEEDDGQSKSPLCSTKLSMPATSGISQPALLSKSIENY